MVEPLSTIAGIVGVTRATIDGTRAFAGFIQDMRNAPDRVIRCRQELNDLQPVLQHLENESGNDSASDAWSDIIRSTGLGSSLETLRSNCTAFHESLDERTRRSDSQARFSSRERLRVAWHEPQIELSSTQSNRCKLTVTMAIACCTMRGNSEIAKRQQEAMNELSASRAELTELFSSLRTAAQEAEDNGESEEVIQATRSDYDAVRRTNNASKEFQSVVEYAAKRAGADNVDMDIGEVIAGVDSKVYSGLRNVERAINLKYKSGKITAGNNTTVMVGWHIEG